ncbi:MAG: hypothetical protein HY074_07455 [Deltaproteobacteria bacterium]|nr:hypothetical protein [Deltaproteobacteria bacterium]
MKLGKWGREEIVSIALYVACLLLVLIGSAVTGQNSFHYRQIDDLRTLQATPVSPK